MSSVIVAAASDELQLVLSVQQFSLGCCSVFAPALLCRAAPWMSVALAPCSQRTDSSYLRPAQQINLLKILASVFTPLAAWLQSVLASHELIARITRRQEGSYTK